MRPRLNSTYCLSRWACHLQVSWRHLPWSHWARFFLVLQSPVEFGDCDLRQQPGARDALQPKHLAGMEGSRCCPCLGPGPGWPCLHPRGLTNCHASVFLRLAHMMINEASTSNVVYCCMCKCTCRWDARARHVTFASDRTARYASNHPGVHSNNINDIHLDIIVFFKQSTVTGCSRKHRHAVTGLPEAEPTATHPRVHRCPPEAEPTAR